MAKVLLYILLNLPSKYFIYTNTVVDRFSYRFVKRKYSFFDINVSRRGKIRIPVSTVKKVKGIYVTFA